MAIVIQCDNCSFRRSGPRTKTYFLTDNKEERIISPTESIKRLEDEANCDWHTLLRTQRVRVRHGLLCLSCGNLDYYSPVDSHSDLPHETLRKRRAYRCTTCQGRDFLPLAQQNDTFCAYFVRHLFFLNKDSGTESCHRTPTCPNCRIGELVVQPENVLY